MYRKAVYFYYIALLLVQTVSTWQHHWGCWGKHCHGKDSHEWCSKEKQSNERQSHERRPHYHGHNCGKDSSSEEDDENVNETDEVEDNTSPTRNSEIEDGDSYEFQNSSTIKYTCVMGYCYYIIQNTTYPPRCPYRDRVSYGEYNNIALNVVAGLFGIRFWVDVKRNKDYGYYEWLELGSNYGNIFNEAVYKGGDCVVLQLGLHKFFSTQSCNNTNEGMCIHRRHDKNKNFCDLYEEICGTSSKCYCYAARANFSCQSVCQNYVNEDCQLCEQKFVEYPQPSISLQFLRSKQTIYITLENSLKLAYINGNRQVFCFTDVYTPSATKIRERYSAGEIELERSEDDTVIYSIKPKDLGPGSYWCEGFKYPDLEKITSNTIIADITGMYTANFVLNLTLQLSTAHTFLPYNIHTTATRVIDNVVEYDFKSIRPAYVSVLFNEGSNVNISLHLTTAINSSTSEAYQSLTKSLNFLDSEEVSVDAITNSRSCMSTTTIIDGKEITWPEVELGQITPPSGIYLQADGTSITRSCMGSFQTGAEWSEVVGEISSNEVSAVTHALFTLRSSNKSASELNLCLKELMTTNADYVAYDVYLIAQIFQDIARSEQPFDMGVYVENINSVMNFKSDILEASQIRLNATDIILYSFDLALISSINNNKGDTEEINNATVTMAQNIFAQVVNLKANNIIGLAVYDDEGGDYLMTNITKGMKFTEVHRDNLVFAVFLPPTLLEQILLDLQHKDEINFVTAIFLHGALFNSKNNSKTENSLILSMFVDGFQAGYLEEPIPIVFKSLLRESDDAYCGFWEYGIDSLWAGIFGFWTVDKRAIYDATYDMCKFTHMTHFALLVNGVEDIVLNYISIIGCVLSILGILGIFATAVVSKSWREGAGTQILLNYSTAILIQMIVLLFSDMIAKEGQRILCIFTGMVIHYTIICQFLWMLIISYLQYRKFVQVLVQEPEKLVLKSCIFAWITPIFFVAIIAFCNIESYRQKDTCYLSGLSLYLGLFLPIVAVISINIVLFVLIFKSVLYRKTQAYGVNKKLVGLKIKLAVILFFLMGFSWIFGLFAGVLKSLFLSYIFSISATIQGLVLYLYFVICNKSTRKMWRRKINQMLSLCNARSRLENEDSKSNTSSDDFKMKK